MSIQQKGLQLIYRNINNFNPVNINNASFNDLLTKLSHCRTRRGRVFGPITADNFIKYREQNGKFDRVDKIIKVKGIGYISFYTLRHHIKLK